MSFSAAGMGTSGVYSQSFSFAVPIFEHGSYASEFPGGSPVILSGSDNSPTFYISSKTADDISVKITCYDRMTFTEADFPCTEEDFLDENGEEIPMSIYTVLSRITEECGFLHYFVNDNNLLQAVPEIPKSMLLGRTCRDVLSDLANAFCGYWCCSGDLAPDLLFIPFGADISQIAPNAAAAEFHEKLKASTNVTVLNVYLTGNDEEFGSDPGGSDTVRIDTPLANRALYDALSERICVAYSGVNCGNAFINSLPTMPFRVDFAGEETVQYVNFCTAKISSCGILASLGRNKTDEGTWVYKNRTRRELEKRYAEGDVWKNVCMTKKGGLSIVYFNAN